MGRRKKDDDGFDIRTALLIPAEAVSSFIQNGDAEIVGEFILEYCAYALYGLMPERFGERTPDMDRKEIGLVTLMKKCMSKTDEDKVKYEKKSESMRENANRRHHPEWYNNDPVNDQTEPAEPAEPSEPSPAPKKRTAARKSTGKKTEKKETAELTPEEIAIKEKNDSGEEIFFAAWERYDENYKGTTYRGLIERDASGRNELLEELIDIGKDELFHAIDTYKAYREANGLYKKGSKTFFADREFRSYIGKPAVVSNKKDDEFDEFNTVD